MIEHLSYSSISSYLMCGANWQFKYIQNIKTPTSPELVFGSAFHGTVEAYVGNNHQGVLTDLWRENWAKQIEGQNVDWGTDTPENFSNEGMRMLSHPEIIKGILAIKAQKGDQGAKIEQKVELHVPGVPIPIIGYIDIITEDRIPGDLKTSGKSWSPDKALFETQPLFYLAALNQAGIQKPGWRFKHYIFVKTKTPQFQVLEHTHNAGQLMWLFKMIKHVWDGIEAGIFPENPSSWKCSPNYCEYWPICRGKYG
jgi:PD-(D/E)XK nuclease superfamily